MEDELTRAQHYRALAAQMRDAAQSELDQKRRQELLDIANQYENLADKLVGKYVGCEREQERRSGIVPGREE